MVTSQPSLISRWTIQHCYILENLIGYKIEQQYQVDKKSARASQACYPERAACPNMIAVYICTSMRYDFYGKPRHNLRLLLILHEILVTFHVLRFANHWFYSKKKPGTFQHRAKT